MTVTQPPFEWHQPGDLNNEDEVALQTKTIEIVVTLMASVMIAVLRGVHTEEAGDER